MHKKISELSKFEQRLLLIKRITSISLPISAGSFPISLLALLISEPNLFLFIWTVFMGVILIFSINFWIVSNKIMKKRLGRISMIEGGMVFYYKD